MFAIEDKFVALAYLLCLLSTLLCVTYGILKWNKDGQKVSKKDVEWAKEEKQVEEEL